jgi:hypothetical protein
MPLKPRAEVVQPLDQSYRLIPLTCDQVCIVDAEDFEFLSQWNWKAAWCSHSKTFRVTRTEKLPNGIRTTVYIHRVIAARMGFPAVDHKDHDTLNNRRKNLRPCTHSQNGANKVIHRNTKTPYKGIWFQQGKWTAILRKNGVRYYGGRHDTAESAARAYDALAIEHFGEFAYLNFPTSSSTSPALHVLRCRRCCQPGCPRAGSPL